MCELIQGCYINFNNTLYFWVRGCCQNALIPEYPGVQYSLFSFFSEETQKVKCVKTIAEGSAKKKKATSMV